MSRELLPLQARTAKSTALSETKKLLRLNDASLLLATSRTAFLLSLARNDLAKHDHTVAILGQLLQALTFALFKAR